MFGIMQYRHAENDRETTMSFRSSYCGTCKALGVVYGQYARPLVNFDLVFLSEFLTVLSGKNPLYHHIRHNAGPGCIPLTFADRNDVPVSFRIAAAFNVLFAHYKIADHVEDSGGLKNRGWKVLHRFSKASVQQAEKELAELGIDTAYIKPLIDEGQQLEKIPFETGNPLRYAHPTGKLSGESYVNSALSIQSNTSGNTIYNIGYQLGIMAYLTDAYLDFEKDRKAGEFNPLKGMTTEERFGYMQSQMQNALGEFEHNLQQLSIPLSYKNWFVFRLRQNLEEILQSEDSRRKVLRTEAAQQYLSSSPAQQVDFWKKNLRKPQYFLFGKRYEPGRSLVLLVVSLGLGVVAILFFILAAVLHMYGY